MSMRDLERSILEELQIVTGNPKLKVKDIMEWSNAKLKPHDGEELHYLPNLKVYCCIKRVEKKKK